MGSPLWSRILLVLMVSTPFGARAESRCTVIHDALTEIVSGHRAPTLEEAMGIVGDERAPVQVRRALDHLLKMPNQYQVRIQTLAQLFQAIRHRQYFTWSFEKFTGPDGEVGFVGDQGYFVLLKYDGRILKGTFRVERDLNDYGEWNGRADEVYEVRASTSPSMPLPRGS